MKTIICIILAIVSSSFAQAQESLLHTWRAALTVVDETNQPVPDAEISVIYDAPRNSDGATVGGKISGLTDTNGLFSASHHDGTLRLLFRVRKAGYYQTSVPYEIALLGQPVEPAKLTVTETLVLKKIGQPIPMYAKHIHGGRFTTNQPVGYDLVAGDWVAPYGKGQTATILFTKHYKEISKNDYDSKIVISFPNRGDGIQEFIANENSPGSEFRSPHNAPIDGYQPQILRDRSEHRGRPGNFDYDQSRNYFIRVQTILDEQGNVKSALYGKVYGDFMDFIYYLNPEPNSRNVEFDPKSNLLKVKEFDEQAKAP